MVSDRASQARKKTVGVGPRRDVGSGWLALLGYACLLVALAVVDGLAIVPHEARLVAASVACAAAGVTAGCLLSRPTGLKASLASLRLGPWLCIGFALVFGVASLVWLGPVEAPRTVIDPAMLVPALGVALVGLTVVAVAYRFAPRMVVAAVDRVDSNLRGRAPRAIGPAPVFVLWSLAIGAQLLAMATGSFGYLSDASAALSATSSVPAILSLLTRLGLLATLLAAWRYARYRDGGSLTLLVAVTVTQIGTGLLSGLKENVIIQLVALFAGYASRGRVRFAVPLVTGAVVLALLIPFINSYRAAVLTSSGRLTPAEVAENLSLDELAASTASASALESAQQLSWRIARVGDLALILQKTPDSISFKPAGELLTAPVLGVIPRSLWSGKPVLDAGYQMTVTYYEMPRHILSSSAMTPYGDLWRHGGLLVLIPGCVVLGWLLRAIDSRSGDPRVDPALFFLPMLLFTTLVKQEMDAMALFASLPAVWLTATIAARIVSGLPGASIDLVPQGQDSPHAAR